MSVRITCAFLTALTLSLVGTSATAQDACGAALDMLEEVADRLPEMGPRGPKARMGLVSVGTDASMVMAYSEGGDWTAEDLAPFEALRDARDSGDLTAAETPGFIHARALEVAAIVGERCPNTALPDLAALAPG